jgi:hypothetical protein
MNSDTTALIEQAIRMALELSWFAEYTVWAKAWLEGTDRSRDSARLARNRVTQWTSWGGDSWAARCLCMATDAAAEMARSHDGCAKTSAEGAIRAAHLVAELARQPEGPTEPELVFDDWNYGTSPRSRSYDPREV